MAGQRPFVAGWVGAASILGLLLLGKPSFPSWANVTTTPKQVVDEVWQVVNRDYVDPTYNRRDWQETRREVLGRDYRTNEEAYRVIRRMLKTLNDPYTRFLDPKQFATMQAENSGELTGIGLQIDNDKETKEIKVVSPVADTPAYRAELMPGDVILSVDGIAMKGLGREDVAARIRGKAGTTVTLSVQRKSEIFELVLTREVIPIHSVYATVKQAQNVKIGYLALEQFTGHAAAEVRQALQQLLDQKVEGVILDLRGNPGGLVLASTEIAGLFIKGHEVVVSTTNRTGTIQEIKTNGNVLTDKPLVVLVNGTSASSSEILAGALQDYKRASLVGTTTYGKGLVQAVQELGDGSGMTVTVAHYKTPKGRDIHQTGIRPDYIVEIPAQVQEQLTPADRASVKDPQYAQGIQVLLQRVTPKVPKL